MLASFRHAPEPVVPAPDPTQACSRLALFENDRTLQAVGVLLRLENGMSADFRAVDACIAIDGHPVREDDPTTLAAGFAAHRNWEVRVSLPPGLTHEILLVARFAGPTP